MERGNRTVSEMDAARYLALCRENDTQTRRLLGLFTDHDGYWAQPHTVQPAAPAAAGASEIPLREDLLSLSVLECAARQLHFVDLVMVPGLLQTPEYSEAVVRQCGATPERVLRGMLRARRERLSRLRGTGQRKFRFFIHENAVHLTVGDAQVMEDQLLHLLFQASAAEPEVTIRIIPRAAGPHAGMSGGFCLMEYDHHQPVVSLDHALVSVVVDTPAAVEHCQSVLACLDKIAASEEDTRALLLTLV